MLLLLLVKNLFPQNSFFFYTFSGLADENNFVISDKAEELGASLQQNLDHISLAEASL